MTGASLNALRHRLDELRSGRVRPLGLLDRARALWGDLGAPIEVTALRELDRELDRAGIRTSTDAKLLRELGQLKGRLGTLSRGLEARAQEALAAFDAALAQAERQSAAGQLPPGALTRLEEDFGRLARIAKTAAIFQGHRGSGVELFAPRVLVSRVPPSSARVAVVEHLTLRARATVADMERKRRDLDLAHELLLRMSADAREDRDRVRRLRVEVAAARERVRSSPVVRSLDELVRHLRFAARRTPAVAYGSVRALYERAVEAGEAELAGLAAEALERLLPPGKEVASLVERSELRRLLGWRPSFGPDAAPLPAGGQGSVDDAAADVLAQVAFALDDRTQMALELASGAARYFDVEDALAEEVVGAEMVSHRPVHRRVSYPTQVMTYEFTNSLDELSNFVISHPGTVVLDLASNRQAVRAYLEAEPPRRATSVRKTAVRVYVLDASGSMYGGRARFRDAILIAELNAIRVKALQGVPFDPLYFSYFNETPTTLARVDSGSEATRHIERLFAGSPAEGQTDITLALMSAFESIGKAAGTDPYLARATVVLVTDGEDGVDLELIRKTKRPFEGLNIALSFISLGEENADLKTLVMEERAFGSRAFYHHLTDAEIDLSPTEFDSPWRTLLPMDAPVTPDALERLLPFLEALEALARKQPAPAPTPVSSEFEALFPPHPTAPAGIDASLSARLTDILEAVAETAALVSADSRSVEAAALLDHLLKLYGLSVSRYLAAVGATEASRAALSRVRLTCRPFD